MTFAPFLQVLVIVAFGPLVQGAMKSLRARLQGRPGPSPLQPYRDLAKLWGKESIVPDEASPLFIAAPGIALGVALTLAAAVPIFVPGDCALGKGPWSVAQDAVTEQWRS
jgi:formate hydrogenlyase subunit 4